VSGLWEREEWWEAGRNCLFGRYEASGGVWRSTNRLVKEGGLNEEDTGIGYSEGVREAVLVVV
jgi:hypothetical protein